MNRCHINCIYDPNIVFIIEKVNKIIGDDDSFFLFTYIYLINSVGEFFFKYYFYSMDNCFNQRIYAYSRYEKRCKCTPKKEYIN